MTNKPSGDQSAKEIPSRQLLTPIYLKTDPNMQLPDDQTVFLLLSGNGLWLCRNHGFFTSSVPARTWPNELAPHERSLQLHHPQVPRRLIERTVGFFRMIAESSGSEAGVLLAWDRTKRRIRLVVPRQLATVSVGWSGKVFPIGLHYTTPDDLSDDWYIFGDIHSHVYESAYSSIQDKRDEEHRPGLHVVVGRLNREPPEFHAEYVVDGTRFDVDIEEAISGYKKANCHVPQHWIKRVRIKTCGWNGSNSITYGDESADNKRSNNGRRHHRFRGEEGSELEDG